MTPSNLYLKPKTSANLAGKNPRISNPLTRSICALNMPLIVAVQDCMTKRFFCLFTVTRRTAPLICETICALAAIQINLNIQMKIQRLLEYARSMPRGCGVAKRTKELSLLCHKISMTHLGCWKKTETRFWYRVKTWRMGTTSSIRWSLPSLKSTNSWSLKITPTALVQQSILSLSKWLQFLLC